MWKAYPFLISGFLMMPVSVLGFLYQLPYTWVVCPQALIVMFLRHGQHAYDSLQAPDLPDILVALIYYPALGWILSRGARKQSLRMTSLRLILWHFVAIGGAIGAIVLRNRLWSGGSFSFYQ